MKALRQLVRQTTSGGLRGLVFWVALIGCALSHIDRARAQVANAQEPTTVGGPDAPPLNSPEISTLPSSGALSLGQWLLTPTLGLNTLYDSNLYSSTTKPVYGPGLHFHPALSADYNTGIHDTQLYGSIDSIVYPTLDYHNNTFSKQAGMIESYSPLPDLMFTAQGNYAHSTTANVLTNSIPAPITSAGSPAPAGSAGVVATQQTVVNPNDAYTATGTVYKQFNRAFMSLGGTLQATQYPETPLQNLITKSYNGAGGFWFTPVLYAFGDGIQSFNNPENTNASNYFRARAGLGTAQIGLFSGFVYYGQQGSEVYGNGKAGGDIYGGGINYYPTAVWNMSFDVDRLRNISNITGGSPLALAGLPFVPVGVSSGSSLEVTTLTYKTDYTFSPQTSAHFVASYSFGDVLSSVPVSTTSWLADFGISHQLRQDLSLTFDYQYSHVHSPTPGDNLARNVVTVGGNYSF